MVASGSFLVTGASGFIGQRLCEALTRIGRVRALVCSGDVRGPWHEAVVGDVTDDVLPPALMKGVSVVLHLAGRAHVLDEREDNEAAFQRVNVAGTERLCGLAQRAGVERFVLASSVAVLGESQISGDSPVREDAPASPTTAYGRSKRDAERVVCERTRPPQPVVLRFPLVYGPGLRGNLRVMIDAVASGRVPPPPRVPNRRSMIHVDDAVEAFVLAGTAPAVPGKTYTVTDGQTYSTRDIYETICVATGRRARGVAVSATVFKAAAAVGDAIGAMLGRRFVFDSTSYRKLFGSAWYESRALAAETGFAPQWTLQRAMPEMVAEILES